MTEDNSPQDNQDQDELSLTGIIKALDNNESLSAASKPKKTTPKPSSPKPSSPKSSSLTTPSAFDPNATVDYQQAGTGFPELPFADNDLGTRNSSKPRETGGANTRHSQGTRRSSRSSSSQDLGNSQDLANSQNLRNSQDLSSSQDLRNNQGSRIGQDLRNNQDLRSSQDLRNSQDLSAGRPAAIASPAQAAPKRRGIPTRGTSTGSASTRNTSTGSTSARGDFTRGDSSRAAYRGTDNSFDFNRQPLDATNFKPLNARQSTYKIRGGGRRNVFTTHVLIAIVASVVFLAVGVGVVYSVTNSLTNALANSGVGVSFDLTQAETRQAIDGNIPVLINLVDSSIDDINGSMTDAGQYIFDNTSYQPDSPDVGATSAELVMMPQEMTDDQMQGYTVGGLNAYTPEELTQYFNGAFMLDLARGDLGSWNRLRYVNFNATSVEDEMSHLADLQQLSGDTVSISAQGSDSNGNQVIEGQKVIDNQTVLYFKIAACPFKDIYNAKSLTDASVYVTCTVATYDFFTGVDTITANP